MQYSPGAPKRQAAPTGLTRGVCRCRCEDRVAVCRSTPDTSAPRRKAPALPRRGRRGCAVALRLSAAGISSLQALCWRSLEGAKRPYRRAAV
eukprot:scaffold10110_cov69-Phaeocystis_antarctica.AAC.3